MVLGFGKGPERFPPAKEQTPGPGAYEPKSVDKKLVPKIGGLPRSNGTSQELLGDVGDHRSTFSLFLRKGCLNGDSSPAATPRRRLNSQLSILTPRRRQIAAANDFAQVPDQERRGDHAAQDLDGPLCSEPSMIQLQQHASAPSNIFSGQILTTVDDQRGPLNARPCNLASPTPHQLAEPRHELRTTADALEDLSSSRSSQQSEEPQDVRAEARDHGGQSAEELKAELVVLQRREATWASEVMTKEETANVLKSQMVTHLSELASLRFSVGHLNAELKAVKEDVVQRDMSLAGQTAQIADLEKQLDQLRTANGDLTADLQKRRSISSAASAREHTLAAAKTTLELRLEAKDADCKEKEAAITVLQEQLASLQEAASAASAIKLEDAQRTHEQLQQQLDERTKRVQKLEAEAEALTSTLRRQADALARRGKDVEQLRESFNKKEAETAALGTQLAAERASLQARSEELLRLSTALPHRDGVISSLQAEVSRLADTIKDRDKAVAVLTADVQQRVAALTELEATTAGLRHELAAREAVVAENATEHAAALLARDERITQLLAEAKTAAASATAYQERISSLEASLSAVQQNEASLRGQLAITEQRLSEAGAGNQQLQEQCAQLAAELRGAQEANGELRLSRENLARQYALLRSEVQQLQVQGERNFVLIQQLAAMEAELELKKLELTADEDDKGVALCKRVRASFKARADEVMRLSNVMAQRDVTISSLQTKVTELLSIVIDRDNTVTALTTELQQHSSALAALKTEMAQAQQALAERDAAMSALRSEAASRTIALQARDDHISQLLVDTEAAVAVAAAFRERIIGMEARLIEADNEVAKLLRSVAQLKAGEAELQAELRVQRETGVSLFADLSRARAALEDATGREAGLRDQLATARQRLHEAEDLELQLKQKCTQVDELRKEQTEFMQHLVNVTGQGAELHNQLQQLQKQRDGEVAALNQRLAATEDELASKTSTLEALVEEATGFQAALAVAQETAIVQATELAAAQAELDAQAKATAGLQRTVTALEQRVSSAETCKQEAARELSVVKMNLENTAARCLVLETTLNEQKKLAAALGQELEQVRRDASTDLAAFNGERAGLLSQLEEQRVRTADAQAKLEALRARDAAVANQLRLGMAQAQKDAEVA